MYKRIVLTLIILLLLSPVKVLAETKSFIPTDDSSVVKELAQKNYGSESCLPLWFYLIGGKIKSWALPFFKFDISSLQGASKITKASLKVYRCGNLDTEGTFEIIRATGNWSENKINFVTYLIDESEDPSRPRVTLYKNNRSDYLDITSLVKKWFDKSIPNYGFYLKPVQKITTSLYSKEAEDVNVRPKLTIEYEVPTPTPAPKPAPVISNLKVADITPNEATIRWSTNILSDSQVDYGTTISYILSASSKKMVKEHLIRIAGLRPETLYHVKVQSKAEGTKARSSADFTLTTKAKVAATPATSAMPSASSTPNSQNIPPPESDVIVAPYRPESDFQPPNTPESSAGTVPIETPQAGTASANPTELPVSQQRGMQEQVVQKGVQSLEDAFKNLILGILRIFGIK